MPDGIRNEARQFKLHHLSRLFVGKRILIRVQHSLRWLYEIHAEYAFIAQRGRYGYSRVQGQAPYHGWEHDIPESREFLLVVQTRKPGRQFLCLNLQLRCQL